MIPMKRKMEFADRYVPKWRRYVGLASGAVLGGIALNVPGAVAGGYYGYKSGIESEENLTKHSTTMPNTYPTPTTGSRGSRKRKLLF